MLLKCDSIAVSWVSLGKAGSCRKKSTNSFLLNQITLMYDMCAVSISINFWFHLIFELPIKPLWLLLGVSQEKQQLQGVEAHHLHNCNHVWGPLVLQNKLSASVHSFVVITWVSAPWRSCTRLRLWFKSHLEHMLWFLGCFFSSFFSPLCLPRLKTLVTNLSEQVLWAVPVVSGS